MLRYNHATIERKWRKTWEQDQSLDQENARVCTVLIPGDRGELSMENVRLLVLTDFFASIYFGKKVPISVLDGKEGWLQDTSKFGLLTQDGAIDNDYDLAVLPRDYAWACGQLRTVDTLFCGRLLHSGPLRDFLPDFGVDALRIYFLHMGPPTRDYVFQWHGLASAYRFVTRFWELGYGSLDRTSSDFDEAACLVDLQTQVQGRFLQQKPHTALAAIMGYIKHKSMLTKTEVRVITTLLQPFTPFMSSELLQLMAMVQD